jgi:hypothetical protein
MCNNFKYLKEIQLNHTCKFRPTLNNRNIISITYKSFGNFNNNKY